MAEENKAAASPSSGTDVQTFFEDLYAGVFMQKVGMALSQVALGVVEYNRKGKVCIEFDMARIGESQQVMINHTVSMKTPTMRGSRSEDDTTNTPMHVNRGGRLALLPENQGSLFGKESYSDRENHKS